MAERAVAEEYPDLFGEKIDTFLTAKERYGIWPTTVWPLDHQDRTERELRRRIGDSDGRPECFQTERAESSVYQTQASTFSPAVASWALNCYAPTAGVCFDPFAGGGTRAIMAAKHGLRYRGMELRAEEAVLVRQRAAMAGVAELVEVTVGDSRYADGLFEPRSADFLLTCPPYWNLEEYNGGPADLSMAPSYRSFREGMAEVIRASRTILKPGALAVWVVGPLRDAGGGLIPLNHDLAFIHRKLGVALREEIIIHHQNNGAIQRVGFFDKGRRFLIRVHEYVLVFENPRDG